jgi:hypothetical protein
MPGYVGLATVRFTSRRIRDNDGDRLGAADRPLEDGMTQSESGLTDDPGDPNELDEELSSAPEEYGREDPHTPPAPIGREDPHKHAQAITPAIGHRDPH